MQDDIILGGKKKFAFNWKIFGIVMAVVAVLGLTFGVAMLIMKGDEVAKAKAECQAASSGSLPACPDGTNENPVLTAEAPEVYTISVSSSTFKVGDNSAYLYLKLKNGAISECVMNVRDASGSYNKVDCQISGVVGRIYKIVQVNSTINGEFESALGLILTDGMVKYVPLSGVSGSVFSVKGTLHIDGYVADAIGAEVKPNEYLEGSDWTTLFVLKDGKVLKFDETMLEGM